MSIKDQEYKGFSWQLHKKAGHKPIVAQMELTFRCPLHCEHCYSDCYNNSKMAKKELSTKQIKEILDKCRRGGTLWFCFTGGDPLIRKDFIEIYTYAKSLALITSVFSSLVTLDKKILETLKSYPPFNIETTLNAATPSKYREITGTGFFKRHIEAIKLLKKNNLPIKIKSQITRQNVGQIDKMKRLIESLGSKFRPSTMIHARLNGDTRPCNLRLEPKEAVMVNKDYGYFEEEYRQEPRQKLELEELIGEPKGDKLLSCAAGGHAFWITPQGRVVVCSILRKPDYDLLEKNHTVKKGFYRLTEKAHGLRFKNKESPCRRCRYRLICKWCPGRAYLEKNSLEEPIEYFCRQTKEVLKEYAE